MDEIPEEVKEKRNDDLEGKIEILKENEDLDKLNRDMATKEKISSGSGEEQDEERLSPKFAGASIAKTRNATNLSD